MKLMLTNKNNQTLDLLNNLDKFVLISAEGLHGVETDFKEVESPYIDGVNVENVKALARGIELTFKLVGDVKESIDFFTSIVKSKQKVRLTESEGDKEIYIEGVATIPPYTRMSAFCELTLSIYCGQPYWQDIQRIVGAIASVLDLLNFPTEGQYFTPNGRPFGIVDTSLEKTFVNDGDTSVGMVITINARGDVVEPRIACSSGSQLGWFIQVNLTLHEGDELVINTNKGEKSILINGVDTYEGQPILDYLVFSGKDWLQLETGENTFNVVASQGQDLAYFTLDFKRKYE